MRDVIKILCDLCLIALFILNNREMAKVKKQVGILMYKVKL